MPPSVSHLPHPLAVLRIRAENEKSPRGRHDAAYLLWEAGLRLLATVLLAEYQNDGGSCPNLVQPLSGLRGPSTGHWRAIVRELLPVLAARDDDPPLATVNRRLSPKRTVRDMPAAASLAHALATKLRPDRATQPQQTVRLANLFDDMVTYRHEVRAHGGLGDDQFFDRISGLMLAGLDEVFAGVDVLCGRKLVRSDQSDSSSMLGLNVPDWSGSKPNDFAELVVCGEEVLLSLSPWVYWNESHGEMSFFNGFGGGHQKQALYLTYVAGAKTRQNSQQIVELIGGLRVSASSDASEQWIPDYDEIDNEFDDATIKRMGDYQILEVIGEGGMGKVYRAFQPSLQRMVAMKVMRDPHDTVAVARFDREIQSLAKVDHPNLVKIYDSGICGDDYYYTMELVEGINLSSWLKTDDENAGSNDTLAYRQIATLLTQVAAATNVLNDSGIVHRDIKPANIMVNAPCDRAVLLDLGLAHQVDTKNELTRTQQFIGTLRYASPEQATGKPIDARSDVYAIGATLWECLSGQKMHGDSESLSPIAALKAVCENIVPSPSQIDRSVPSELSAITLKCIEKRPEDRYSSAAGVAEDLQRWLDGRPVLAKQTSKRYRVLSFLKRYRRLFATTAAAAAVLLFLGLYLIGKRTDQANKDRRNQIQSDLLRIENLLDSQTNEIVDTTRQLSPLSDLQQEALKDVFSKEAGVSPERRLHAALAIIASDQTGEADQAYFDFVADSMISAEPEQLTFLLQNAKQNRTRVIDRIRESPKSEFDVFGQTNSERRAMNQFIASTVLADQSSRSPSTSADRIINLIVNQLVEGNASLTDKVGLIDSIVSAYPEVLSRLRMAYHHPDRLVREKASNLIALTSTSLSVPLGTISLVEDTSLSSPMAAMIAQADSPDHAMLMWAHAEKNPRGELSSTVLFRQQQFHRLRLQNDFPLDPFLYGDHSKNQDGFIEFDKLLRQHTIEEVWKIYVEYQKTERFESVLSQRLDQQQGWFVSPEYAFSIAAPTDDWMKSAEQLRVGGYRPIKLRPFLHEGTSRIASIFIRDAQPWFSIIGVSADEMREANRSFKGKGYEPVDVAGFVSLTDEGTHEVLYSAIWKRSSTSSALTRREMFVGLSFSEWSKDLFVEDLETTVVHSLHLVPNIDSVSSRGTIANFLYSGVSSASGSGERLPGAAMRIPSSRISSDTDMAIFDLSAAVWPEVTTQSQLAFWQLAIKSQHYPILRIEAFLQLGRFEEALAAVDFASSEDTSELRMRELKLLKIRGLLGAKRFKDAEMIRKELFALENRLTDNAAAILAIRLSTILRIRSNADYIEDGILTEEHQDTWNVRQTSESDNPFENSIEFIRTARRTVQREMSEKEAQLYVDKLAEVRAVGSKLNSRSWLQIAKAAAAAANETSAWSAKSTLFRDAALSILPHAIGSGDDPRVIEMDHDFDSIRQEPAFREIFNKQRGPYWIWLDDVHGQLSVKREITTKKSVDEQLAYVASMDSGSIPNALSVASLDGGLDIVFSWRPADKKKLDLAKATAANQTRLSLILFAITNNDQIFEMANEAVATQLRTVSRKFREWEKRSRDNDKIRKKTNDSQ